MILLVIIFSCIFASVLLIGYYITPEITRRYTQQQEERADVFQRKLDKMYIDISKKKLLYFCIISPILVGAVGMVLFQNIWVGIAMGFVVGTVMPSFVLNAMDKIRKAKFHSQLIDSLMILSSSLKAGLSLRQAMEVLIEEMPAPICQEFDIVLKEESMGVSLEEALQHLRDRMPSDELNMFATSIAVGRETGGDLNKIFSRMAKTIRQKDKLTQNIKTLTLQGKIQGWVMAALPVVFGLVMFRINKDFFKIMMNSQLGQGLLIYAAVSLLAGMFMVKKISTIEV